MASNFFTPAEQAHYAYLIACYQAEREGKPQPAPHYLRSTP